MMQEPFLSVKPVAAMQAALQSPAKLVLLNLLVVIVYTLTGLAGLQVAFIGDVVTLFWPPSGVAFAMVWLGGVALVPGIALGAFVTNMVALGVPRHATLVAVGSVMAPMFASLVLRRLLSRHGPASELPRMLWFLLVGVLGAPMLSASVGTLAMALTGVAPDILESTWLTWWLGDAMGVLLIAPPILLWASSPGGRPSPSEAIDIALQGAVAAVIVTGLFMIRGPIWAMELCRLLTLLICMWSAIRFGLKGAAAMSFVMAGGAILPTIDGVGPFVRGTFYDSLALLHSHLFAEAVAGLLLAAALTDLRGAIRSERRARDIAEQAAAERIRLLTMISHDVRTPLGGILGVLQNLRLTELAAGQEHLVDLGLRAGRTLTTLVADILDVARADAGRIDLRPLDFDPAASLADIVEIHRDPARDRSLSLDAHGLSDLPRLVTGDRARFEQVIGNLVANAIAYTRAGSVEVHASWHPEAARPLVVEVSDTGPGIDPASVPRLFEASAIVPRSGARSAGLGLGLHICGRLVALMDGMIAYRPGDDGGSVFHVELPFASEAAAGALAPSPPAIPTAGHRILLVEDEPISQEVTAGLLRGLGQEVFVAGDADGAMLALRGGQIDLILMDIQLDGGPDGVELARRIRDTDAVPSTCRIVALTADASADRFEIYRAAGMDQVLLKPVLVADLVELLSHDPATGGRAEGFPWQSGPAKLPLS